MTTTDFGKIAVLLGGCAGARSRGPMDGDATVEAYVGRPSDAIAEGNER